MRTVAKIQGLKQLERKLIRATDSLSESKQRAILAEAGEFVLAEQIALVPVLSGDLRSSLDMEQGAEVALYVGPRRGKGSIAHFLEFGTVFMAAQPFILPAFDNTEGVVRSTIARGIRAALRSSTKG